jgi:hypothetical protein
MLLQSLIRLKFIFILSRTRTNIKLLSQLSPVSVYTSLQKKGLPHFSPNFVNISVFCLYLVYDEGRYLSILIFCVVKLYTSSCKISASFFDRYKYIHRRLTSRGTGKEWKRKLIRGLSSSLPSTSTLPLLLRSPSFKICCDDCVSGYQIFGGTWIVKWSYRHVP